MNAALLTLALLGAGLPGFEWEIQLQNEATGEVKSFRTAKELKFAAGVFECTVTPGDAIAGADALRQVLGVSCKRSVSDEIVIVSTIGRSCAQGGSMTEPLFRKDDGSTFLKMAALSRANTIAYNIKARCLRAD